MNERERDEPLSHGAPDEVTLMLGELRDVDPPADLAGSVMARISSQAPARDARPELVQTTGGKAMAKKVLWSVMGAAAAVLIVLKMAGYPPPSEGTEGTIGAAQRYQSQQIADKDVKVTDAELQQFMQSDAFRKIVADKALRQALASDDVRFALANDAVRYALKSDDVRLALANDQIRLALLSDEARKALADENVRLAIANDQVRMALANEQLRLALANDQVRLALANDQVRLAISSPELIGLLANADSARLLAAPGFSAALEAAAAAAEN